MRQKPRLGGRQSFITAQTSLPPGEDLAFPETMRFPKVMDRPNFSLIKLY